MLKIPQRADGCNGERHNEEKMIIHHPVVKRMFITNLKKYRNKEGKFVERFWMRRRQTAASEGEFKGAKTEDGVNSAPGGRTRSWSAFCNTMSCD